MKLHFNFSIIKSKLPIASYSMNIFLYDTWIIHVSYQKMLKHKRGLLEGRKSCDWWHSTPTSCFAFDSFGMESYYFHGKFSISKESNAPWLELLWLTISIFVILSIVSRFPLTEVKEIQRHNCSQFPLGRKNLIIQIRSWITTTFWPPLTSFGLVEDFERAIFQTFWKDDCCPDFLFFEIEISNFGYLLIF